jgi:5-methylcytosine-specific restriction endonuclease McrA
MPVDWSVMFDHFGVKRVTRTDKQKSAYVLNEQQRDALAAAGRDPADREIFAVEVLFDPDFPTLDSSYYQSEREGAGRTPEIRMGRAFIAWANVGDEIILGSKGRRVIAAKLSAVPASAAETGREIAKKGDRRKIINRALRAKGKPARKIRQVGDFVRDPYVVAAALLRANGSCEMPNCSRELFKRDDGSRFLEVHHITPLAEGGDDTLANAAGLCPACHRELHFGAKRASRRALLSAAIAAKPLP